MRCCAIPTTRCARSAQSGCVMIFFGVESGSNRKLAEMNKQITAEQSLELAARIRQFGHRAGILVHLRQPARLRADTRETIAFIRKVKHINPEIEIIVQTYVPAPQRDGDVWRGDGQARQFEFPTTPEEWATERWYRFTMRKDPQLSWLRARAAPQNSRL